MYNIKSPVGSATEKTGISILPVPGLFKKDGNKRGWNMKNATLRNIQQQREKYKESGAWLCRSIDFDPNVYLINKYKILSCEFYYSLNLKVGYTVEQKILDFEILLANLFKQRRRPIRVSLSRNSWKINQYNPVNYYIIDIIKELHKKEYIKMKIGNKIKNEPSRMTRIWPTQKLLDVFPEYDKSVISKPYQLVILRNSKGQLKEYKDTAETRRIRNILQRVNEVNSNADIRYHKYKLNANLEAIFNERFTWYGRLHTIGYRHYQGMSGDERSEITINGDPIVELDYSALHPNLLYAAEGIQYRGDPYSIVDKRPEARPFLKQILLSMLNAKDWITAERSANYWLLHNHIQREQLHTIGIKSARIYMEKFLSAHKPIAKYFCKGKQTGMRIMNRDSKIALEIIDHFAKRKIPVLAIHDSFIVQEQYRLELYRMMKITYKKQTGFDIKVK